jgi:xylulokinase
MRSVVPGLWNPLAYIAGGGLVQRWYRDNFFNTYQGKSQPCRDDLYDAMAEQAGSVPPGAEGLFFSPHLGGRICPAAPAMRGAWTGFSWGHTQGHFIRAILESVAYEYAYYLGILRELIPNLDLIEARVIGGGARNPLWNQIKADVLGIPFQRLQRTEFATWGCALIAGYAVGLFSDLAQAAEEATTLAGDPFHPNPDAHTVYIPLAEQYIQRQQTLRSLALI